AVLAVQACEKRSAGTKGFASQVGQEQAARAPGGFALESPTFKDGTELPRDTTKRGGDRPPELGWSREPSGTQSLALEVLDVDAARGPFAHWLVWDIPKAAHRVDPTSALQGKNDYGQVGWGGPEPPAGTGAHHYVFRLYALDVPKLDVKAGATRAELERAMRGHVLATTEITGLYGK
ncbi:MAG TPA: YbhB/YbcL family Raf kinase inhibitor-like protein, partial [Minicystis sp.]|nr:YbhB/YbcL family Raf kinase inhibitor-like protein [Minicystis sp.]